MPIHIKIDMVSIRVFDGNKNFKNKDKYKAIATGIIIGDNTIHIQNSHGIFTRQDINEIQFKLNKMGYTIITFERRGKIVEKLKK